MARALLIWAALGTAIAVPIAIAATSPLLAYRDAIYITGGLAGVTAMALILLQPLLAGGTLPGLPIPKGRRIHRWIGAGLIACILIHVGALWLTSPPDMIDALTFTAPTAFSAWGVVAMWAAFGAATLAALRRPLKLRPRLFRLGHTTLVIIVATGSTVHALLIEGTMGTVSKAVLCLLVVAATAKSVLDLRAWAPLARQRQ